MKFGSLILLASFTLLLSACKKSGIQSYSVVQLYDCVNHSFSGTPIRVCFDSLITDSRCPKNAVCVWAGTAIGKFSVKVNDQQASFTLCTFPVYNVAKKDTIAFGYKFEFADLTPYPDIHAVPPFPPKKARINITKL